MFVRVSFNTLAIKEYVIQMSTKLTGLFPVITLYNALTLFYLGVNINNATIPSIGVTQ